MLLVLVVASGCSDRRPPLDAERGQRAVVASLDAWKSNDPPTKMTSLPDPVDFTEELRGTYVLTEYTIDKVDTSDQELLRYTVTLKLKDRKGKMTTREAVYAVALKTPIVVTRDPYY